MIGTDMNYVYSFEGIFKYTSLFIKMKYKYGKKVFVIVRDLLNKYKETCRYLS